MALLASLSFGLALVPAAAPAAQAEGVLNRVARTGRLQLLGPADQPPLLSLDGQGQPQGYAVVVADRVAALLSQALGRPVQLSFQRVGDPAQLAERLGAGQADLACGVMFTWARENTLDFTLPIGVSGLRLLAPAGRFTGAPESLAGRRIGVVAGSLADSELRGMQPAAKPVVFADLPAALNALSAGQVEGVIGDSAMLAGLVRQRGLSGLALTPDEPYERYSVACAVPENDSAYRDLVNRAIAQLLQGYVDGDPQTVAAVDRWLGPGSALNIPQERIRGVFDGLLMGVEALRPVNPAP
ncbi:MAG: extracellular substrate binding-like orphan protein GrrP [Vulcanococcus sp.]